MKRSLLITLIGALALVMSASAASAYPYDFGGKVVCTDGTPMSGAMVHVQYQYIGNYGGWYTVDRYVPTGNGKWQLHIDVASVGNFRASHGNCVWALNGWFLPGIYRHDLIVNCDLDPDNPPTGEKSGDEKITAWGSVKALYK